MNRESENPRGRRSLEGSPYPLGIQVVTSVPRLPPPFQVVSQPLTLSVPEMRCSPMCVAACLGFWELTLLQEFFLNLNPLSCFPAGRPTLLSLEL